MNTLELYLFNNKSVLFKIRELLNNPKVRVHYHKDNFVLNLVRKLVPGFKYTTLTLGNHIFVPDDFLTWDYSLQVATITHEYIHVLDREKSGLLAFYAKYLFPQNLGLLALLSLGALWQPWFLASLLALVAFFEWPSRYRSEDELRGYTAALRVLHLMGVPEFDIYQEAAHIVKDLEGVSYFYCCKDAEDKVHLATQQALEKLPLRDTVLLEPFMMGVQKILQE